MSKKVEVAIVGNNAGLKRSLKDSQKDVTSFSSEVGKAAKTAAKLFGAFEVGKQVVDFFKDATEAASKQQQATARLNVTLKDSGVHWAGAGKAVEGYLQKQSELTGFMRNDLSDAFANNIRSTGSVAKSQKLLGIEMDVARTKGLSLAAASSLINRVQNGSFLGLKKLGIAYTKTTTNVDELKATTKKYTKEQLDAAKSADIQANKERAIALVKQKFGGQSAAYAKTEAGAVDRLKAIYEELQIEIGSKVLPVIARLATSGADLIESISKTKQFHDALHDLGLIAQEAGRDIVIGFKDAVAIGKAVFESYEKNRVLFKTLAVIIFAVTAPVTALGIALVLLYRKNETFRTAVQATFGWLKQNVPPILHTINQALVTTFTWAQQNIPPIVQGIANVIRRVWGAIGPSVKAIFDGIKGVITGALTTIKGFINLFGDILHGRWSHIWGDLKQIVSGAWQSVAAFLGTLPKAILPLMKKAGFAIKDGIVSGLEGLGGDLWNAIKAGLGALKSKLTSVHINVHTFHGIPDGISLSGFAKGGVVNKPAVMVGEEAPRHPEVVISTNPQYRDANLGYFAKAGQALGIPGFAAGGVVGARANVAKWKSRLATDTKSKNALEKWLFDNHSGASAGSSKKPNPLHPAYVQRYNLLHDPSKGTLARIKHDSDALSSANKDLASAIKAQAKKVKASNDIPNTTQFGRDVDALNANLARDSANNFDPLGNLSSAEKGDLTSLIGRFQSRITTLNALRNKKGTSAALKDAINQELASDYSTLRQYQDQLNAPANTGDTSAPGDSGSTGDTGDSGGGGLTQDQQAQLDQAALISANYRRSLDLGRAASGVLGGTTINVNTLHPGDPTVLRDVAAAVVNSLAQQPSVSASRQGVFI